jgi:hypothetical protein
MRRYQGGTVAGQGEKSSHPLATLRHFGHNLLENYRSQGVIPHSRSGS